MQNTIEIPKNVVIPQPQNYVPFAFQPTRPVLVDSLAMMPAVDLYDHLLLQADKVDDVRPDRLLSSELRSSHLPVCEPVP